MERAPRAAKNQPVARVVGYPRAKLHSDLHIDGHSAAAAHPTTDVWHGTALTFALLRRHHFGWRTLRKADRT